MSKRLANLVQSLGWATLNPRKCREPNLSEDGEISTPHLGGVTVVSHSKYVLPSQSASSLGTLRDLVEHTSMPGC
jgi:hypothetical protein